MSIQPIKTISFFAEGYPSDPTVFISRWEPPAQPKIYIPTLHSAIRLSEAVKRSDFVIEPTEWGWFAYRDPGLPKYSKPQILEACQTVKNILQAEGFEAEYLTAAECVLDDLVDALDGRLKFDPALMPKPETADLIVPGFGFAPLRGFIVPDDDLGNRVEWLGGSDDDHK